MLLKAMPKQILETHHVSGKRVAENYQVKGPTVGGIMAEKKCQFLPALHAIQWGKSKKVCIPEMINGSDFFSSKFVTQDIPQMYTYIYICIL